MQPQFKNKRNPTVEKPVKMKKEATAKIRQLTPTEYKDLRGVSLQVVTRALKKGNLNSKTLTGVKAFSRHGRFYLLTVDMDLATPAYVKAAADAQAKKKK